MEDQDIKDEVDEYIQYFERYLDREVSWRVTDKCVRVSFELVATNHYKSIRSSSKNFPTGLVFSIPELARLVVSCNRSINLQSW